MAKNKLEDFVSEDGFDLCVLCETKTEYKTTTHIDLRDRYIEGVGQTCSKCYLETELLSDEYHNFINNFLDGYL